ncbi:MAG: DUF6371 domain-containing protein [Candidatus Cryptobacteroides sp.]
MYSNDLKYRYRLETYDPKVRKHICPGCEKRTFVRYIDVQTGEYVSTDVGRCDREEKCGYHKTPRDFFAENGLPSTKEYFFPKRKPEGLLRPGSFSTVKMELVDSTRRNFSRNSLMCFLTKRFGSLMTDAAASCYKVGTSKYWDGATVFWQIDIKGRCRTGKIMLYDPNTGHRVKNPTSKVMWVHKLPMFSDFHLKQCLFGEHLLEDNGKAVAIVESEKTAIIASIFFPDTVWLATGGLNNLREETTRCLMGRRIFLFPDLGAEDKWVKLANSIPTLRNAVLSMWLSRNSDDRAKAEGFDIGDWLVNLDKCQVFRVEDYI